MDKKDSASPAPPRTLRNQITNALIFGFLAGLIVCFAYLFMQREREEAALYKNYFTGIVIASETFKKNAAAIYERALGLPEKIKAATDETALREKEEFFLVIAENINACEYAKKEIDRISEPLGVGKTRNDMINFFDSGAAWLDKLKKAAQSDDRARVEALKIPLDEIEKYKISGYDY